MNKILLLLACVGAAAVLLTGCYGGYYEHRGYYDHGYDHGYGGGYDQNYDAYYDGYYGPYYDGYWAGDGGFYYTDEHRSNWHRDDGQHFRHERFEHSQVVHGHHGDMQTHDTMQGHDNDHDHH